MQLSPLLSRRQKVSQRNLLCPEALKLNQFPEWNKCSVSVLGQRAEVLVKSSALNRSVWLMDMNHVVSKPQSLWLTANHFCLSISKCFNSVLLLSHHDTLQLHQTLVSLNHRINFICEIW